jgi:hypothetical protein
MRKPKGFPTTHSAQQRSTPLFSHFLPVHKRSTYCHPCTDFPLSPVHPPPACHPCRTDVNDGHNTREKLRAHDPGLAGLLQKVRMRACVVERTERSNPESCVSCVRSSPVLFLLIPTCSKNCFEGPESLKFFHTMLTADGSPL